MKIGDRVLNTDLDEVAVVREVCELNGEPAIRVVWESEPTEPDDTVWPASEFTTATQG